jgi:hypothetical protein
VLPLSAGTESEVGITNESQGLSGEKRLAHPVAFIEAKFEESLTEFSTVDRLVTITIEVPVAIT